MEAAFEKFRKAKQYIAERNYKELTTMLNKMLKKPNTFFYRCDAEECFESITNRMIACEFYHMIFTEPDFFDNKKFHKLCYKIEEEFVDLDYHSLICFDHFIMSSVKKENRINVIRIILQKIKLDSYSDSLVGDYMKNVVWYAAFEDDDTLLEEIYNLAENEINPVFHSEIKSWMWMYLKVIIDKNRYDLLDKTITLIYGKENYDFTSLYITSLTNMTYSDFICMLYRRYCPEISDSQIAEKLLESMYFQNLYYVAIFKNDISPKEFDCVMKLNLKTNNANCVLALWLLSHCTYSKEYLYDFLKDKPVLYLNNPWIERCVSHNKIDPAKYKFLLSLLEDVPGITLSIDNCSSSKYTNFNINSIQLEELFSLHKPVMTDNVRDNQLLMSLIKTESKKLRPLLKALTLDEKSAADLIKLCVKSKNTYALSIINEYWKNEEQ